MRYHHEAEERLFPHAAFYRHLQACDAAHESAGRYFPYSERHLHALWFDDHLRPGILKTSRGELVTVESPGRWNLEAGPDFLGAALRIGREQRRLAGDAEIHIFPVDWKSHGHHTDPRYANVRVHVTWFPGPADPALFPPGTVHISYVDSCTADLESIDLSAYPYHEPRAAAQFPLSGKPPEGILQILENAGEERLRQKTRRLMHLTERHGEAQALYEETAAALGYKHNKAPFRALAERLPLEVLNAEYGADWKSIYAVLLGVSGLLPSQSRPDWPPAVKREWRTLWDGWWREQHKWEHVESLGKTAWRLAGVRPLNHPVRRLCALSQWIASGFFEGRAHSPNAPRTDRRSIPANFAPCFWLIHTGWSEKEKPVQLVGTGRLRAIEMNVLVPYRLMKGDGTALQNLPIEPLNSMIRETAYALFGPDHSPSLYRSALARQGLLQIFNDFILTGRLDELLQAM